MGMVMLHVYMLDIVVFGYDFFGCYSLGTLLYIRSRDMI